MSEASNSPPSAGGRRWGMGLGVGVVLLAAVGGALCWWWLRPVDWDAVYAQNNHAITVMEGSHYDKAIPEFEKVVRLAPDWLPGRINLGIALLNAGGDEPALLPRCRTVFEEVLKRDADNPHAHFCLGLLLMYQQDPQDAIKHYEAVLRKDPQDAYSWYWLGMLKADDLDEQSKYLEKALKLNRHLSGAIYKLSQNLRRHDPDRAQKMLDEFEELKRSEWANFTDIKYSRMGPYAEVIGRTGDPLAAPQAGPLPLFQRSQSFKVQLAAGARWAKAEDLGADAVGEVRRLVRKRFGATMVVLDYNADGKPDLFLAGAVVENGKVRDLLLRNEGSGRFTDVTSEAGLGQPRPTLGCCVGDYDNDELPDLLLTGVGVQKLFRNTGKGKFEDVTAQTTLDKLTSVALSAAFVDLDQDADLDMIVCVFAASADDAVKLLKGEKVKSTGELAVYLHQGMPEVMPNPVDKSPPLSCKSTKTLLPAFAKSSAALVGLALSDLDGDRDLDFLLLEEQASPAIAINDRLLHFRRAVLPEKLLAGASWNGALVFDLDHDAHSDVLLLATEGRPRLLHNRAQPGQESPGDWFEADSLALDGPPLRQAVAVDVNLDSWTDVIGLSREGIPVLLQNLGGKLLPQAEALGRDADWPHDLVAVAVCDANGDLNPDLFVWSESDGLQLHESRGNGGQAVLLQLVGRRASDRFYQTRCNYDGVGAWAVAQSGSLWAGQENTTLSAGLGQSRQPLLFGLGRYPRIELLRLRWPDGTLQAEWDKLDEQFPSPELRAGKLYRVVQRNRLPGSCPILFAWDGRRFVFVNDFLGAGSIGEMGPDGTCRPPRPEESIKIESEQLVTRDGQYVLKITEPMDETTYLDRLQLVVVDQPPGVRVYPEERFVTNGPPSQQLVAFGKEINPVRATDQRGRDVTDTLRRWDRVAVDDFAKLPWMGFAEDHAIELDFGDRLAKFGSAERLFLCLVGWTEYPFPESSWAAHQAGVREQWPILERQDDAGRWQSLGEAGFPAGLPRMMLVDVTGKLNGPRCRLRLRTNMHICWDQAFVAADCRIVTPGGTPVAYAPGSPRATCLEVQEANLAAGRIPGAYSPLSYDLDRPENVPLVRQSGRLTRFGDVTELLHRRDDRFVIFGPGDDLTVRFDAASLPPLSAGWRRSFVLRTAGYCKDNALSTAHGMTVEPLPFAAMGNYPYAENQRYPQDAAHQDYLRRFLTREIRAEPSLRGQGR